MSIEPSPVAPLSPSPTTSPAVTPLQPTLESSPQRPPSHVPGLAASNRLWENWYEDCWFGAFDIASSVEALTSQSEVVVRGTIGDLFSRERNFGDTAHAKVLITEVLKGEPVSDEAGTVEVQVGFAGDLEELRSRLPAHDHLWFLVHSSTRDPDNQSAINEFTYFTTDYVQVSVLRGIGGVVRVIMPEAIADAFSPRHFPVPLEGTSFEELVDRVRELAAGPSAAVQLLTVRAPRGEPAGNRFFAC